MHDVADQCNRPGPDNYIRKTLKRAGQTVVLGLVDGRRPHSSDAYRLDAISAPSDAELVWVECGPKDGQRTGIVVDHHCPGDPGYGMPAQFYWEASSIGQVCRLLQIEPTREMRFAAAADHCLTAAYAGQCPGIDPDELMRWRIRKRARHQGRSEDELLRDVQQAQQALLAAPKYVIAGAALAQMSAQRLREIDEAAARLGMGFLCTSITPSGRIKHSIKSAPAPAVEAWMSSAAHDFGLADIYGDPLRGFAGGYVPIPI
jgi:hypothetical protein